MKENRGPLLNGVGDMVTKAMETDELLNGFFTPVFNDKGSYLCPETRGKIRSKKDLCLWEEEQVRRDLNNPNVYKSMDRDGMYLKVLREMRDAFARPSLIIFERSQ